MFYNDRIDEGRDLMSELLARRPSWATVLRGFDDKGLFAAPPGVDLDRLLGI
jgi:hypothetical protein